MAKRLLFPQLTRDHAIQLDNMVDTPSNNEQREQQIHALGIFLAADGLPYGSRVALRMLQELAPLSSRYSSEQYHDYPNELRQLPNCVVRVYREMFEAFDDCLKYIIKEHWEVEVWADRDGSDIKYSSTFYSLEEARNEYEQECRSSRYVRLMYMNEVTRDWEEVETSWTDADKEGPTEEHVHWEVQIIAGEDPDVCAVEDTISFNEEESAYLCYNMHKYGGKYVRLVKVDDLTQTTDVLEVSWMV